MRVVGVDPALGGFHATVVTQFTAEALVILDAKNEAGFAQTEDQLASINETAIRYRPSIVIIEADSQQKGLANDERLAALGRVHGFRIVPHYTRHKKMDVIFGVASMDQSFKKGAIRIPYGDDKARAKMEALIKQLREWRPDIKTQYLTQDLVMALWFCHLEWQAWVARLVTPEPQRQWRPSWVSRDPRFVKATA